jgi:hypothetical protein
VNTGWALACLVSYCPLHFLQDVYSMDFWMCHVLKLTIWEHDFRLRISLFFFLNENILILFLCNNSIHTAVS